MLESENLYYDDILVVFFSRYPDIVEEESKHLSEGFSRFFGDIRAMSETKALSVLGQAFRQFDEVGAEVMNQPPFNLDHVER